MTSRVEPQISTVQLIGDVLQDVRRLVRQEVALARAEIRDELTRVVVTLIVVATALGTMAIGAIWLLVAITRAVATVFLWPLAGVYGGIGAGLVVIGVILLAIAWSRVRALRLLPGTRATLHEHAEWAAGHVKHIA